MGATGSGKSTVSRVCLVVMTRISPGCLQFINLASGSNLRVGKALKSCTDEVTSADEFTLDGKRVILIDTPGFDDTSKSDADVLKMIAAFLAATSVHTGLRRFSISRTELFNRYEKGFKLSGVIYIHRISDKRFTGIAGRNFNMFRELCGDEALKNVVLVTNMWGEVSPEDGQDRENELSSDFFKPVLDKGARMTRHHNTTESAHGVVRGFIENDPVALQIQRELVDEHKDIIDTAAGEVVNRELNEQMRRHQDELRKVQEEMEQALNEKDEEARQELEEDGRKMQEQLDKMKKDSDEMASKFAAEKERMGAKMKEMEQKMERQLSEAEHDTVDASMVDRFKSGMKGLRHRVAVPIYK